MFLDDLHAMLDHPRHDRVDLPLLGNVVGVNWPRLLPRIGWTPRLVERLDRAAAQLIHLVE